MEEEAKLLQKLNYLQSLCDAKTQEHDNLEKINLELNEKQAKYKKLNDEGSKLIKEVQLIMQQKKEQKAILDQNLAELNRLQRIEVRNITDENYRSRIQLYTTHCNEIKLKEQMELQKEKIAIAKALRNLTGWNH